MPNLLGYPISTGMSFHLQKEGNITQNKSVTASLLTSFTLDYYYREMSSGCNTQRFLKQSPHFSCQPDDRMRKKKMTNAPTTLTRDELLKKKKRNPTIRNTSNLPNSFISKTSKCEYGSRQKPKMLRQSAIVFTLNATEKFWNVVMRDDAPSHLDTWKRCFHTLSEQSRKWKRYQHN